MKQNLAPIGIIERIAAATSKTELDGLVKEMESYTLISPVTRRRAYRKANAVARTF